VTPRFAHTLAVGRLVLGVSAVGADAGFNTSFASAAKFLLAMILLLVSVVEGKGRRSTRVLFFL
jgi:hypothetical protein